MLLYELVCLWYICSVTQWESVVCVELCSVWPEYKVCFSDRMSDHTYTCGAVSSPLPFEEEGKGRSRCVLMYGCMPSKFNAGFICWHSPREGSHSHLLHWHVTLFPLRLNVHWRVWYCRSVCYESRLGMDANVCSAVQTLLRFDEREKVCYRVAPVPVSLTWIMLKNRIKYEWIYWLQLFSFVWTLQM